MGFLPTSPPPAPAIFPKHSVRPPFAEFRSFLHKKHTHISFMDRHESEEAEKKMGLDKKLRLGAWSIGRLRKMLWICYMKSVEYHM